MSRWLDFAEAETRNQLRTGPSPERLRTLALKLDAYADAEIKLTQVKGPAVACAKGCDHCCHRHFVTAIIPEVLHLAETIRQTYTPTRLSKLRSRIGSYLEVVQAVPAHRRIEDLRATCPILEGNLCGAFEGRPLACRRHNSVDVQACIQRRSGERKEPAPANREQIEIGNYVLSGWAMGLRRSRLQEAIVELIPALDIALKNPDAAERYLAGEPLFDAVIVAGYDPGPIRRAIKARFAVGIPLD